MEKKKKGCRKDSCINLSQRQRTVQCNQTDALYKAYDRIRNLVTLEITLNGTLTNLAASYAQRRNILLYFYPTVKKKYKQQLWENKP